MPVIRIGYLGPRGTFTEQAVRTYVAKHNTENAVLVACRTIDEVLRLVETGDLQIGVVPAENSIEGSVALTLDYLVHEVDVPIVGEVIIAVRHNLLALPGADPTETIAVYSHPHALAQCRHHLNEIFLEGCTRHGRGRSDCSDKADRAWLQGTELAELYD